MKKEHNNGNIIKKPQFRIDLELIRTNAWTQFVKSPAEPVYWFLLAHIIRGEVDTGGFQLYEDYYCNNSLAARWSQENIAERLGMKQCTVSRHIDKLVEMDLVKKHFKTLNSHSCCLYQLGVHDGNGHEELFLEKALKKEREKEIQRRAQETIDRYRNPEPAEVEDWKQRLIELKSFDGQDTAIMTEPYSLEEYRRIPRKHI